MTHFKHILVAYDGSLNSVQALEMAKEIAGENHARMTIVYVYDSSAMKKEATTLKEPEEILTKTYTGPGPVPTRPIPRQIGVSINEPNQVDEIVTDAKSRLSKDESATFKVLHGKPAKKIQLYAKEHDVDLIVIGHRGLSKVKEMMMGSVSKKVVNNATCPVLVAK